MGVSTDRPVINKTGITGFIDYEIIFSQDGVDSVAGTEVRILDAVKKQLGMKLESAKGNVDFLVIDGVRRPSEN